jgi:hypothetical protein
LSFKIGAWRLFGPALAGLKFGNWDLKIVSSSSWLTLEKEREKKGLSSAAFLG